MILSAQVRLWQRSIAAVTWLPDRELAAFQYTSDFIESGIAVAPLTMPLRSAAYEFSTLPRASFHGLPGLLADSLPDRFGHQVIDAWLATQGREPQSMNPVERLCYVGERAMGALEFQPSMAASRNSDNSLQLDSLVELANLVVNERSVLQGRLTGRDDSEALSDILRVGTSAGGARAKAVLLWNEHSGEFRSGQVGTPPAGFSHWLLKFDGIHNNRDKELADPQGFGRIEYAYALMARDAGIVMPEARLYEENGRAHFMVKRFDRDAAGGKRHMQSLAALRHFDYNNSGAYSYEQALLTIRQLGLPASDVEQQVRRAFFNVLARNQDDHVKNIAFLMDKRGEWRLSPAFDLVYSYNPSGAWTSRHQMSLNSKRDNFRADDLLAFAAAADIKKARARALLLEVAAGVQKWQQHARHAGVMQRDIERIASTMRLDCL